MGYSSTYFYDFQWAPPHKWSLISRLTCTCLNVQTLYVSNVRALSCDTRLALKRVRGLSAVSKAPKGQTQLFFPFRIWPGKASRSPLWRSECTVAAPQKGVQRPHPLWLC